MNPTNLPNTTVQFFPEWCPLECETENNETILIN